MKVILLSDVSSLGKHGNTVEVSAGHARNFLFPQNLAVSATEKALRAKDRNDQEIKKKANKELSMFGDLASRLDGHEVVVKQKTNETGKFYGAVNQQHVILALKKDGFGQVDKSMIKLEPLKEPGEATAKIVLPHGFEAEIKVVAEQV